METAHQKSIFNHDSLLIPNISHKRDEKEHFHYFFISPAIPLVAKPEETDGMVVLETEIGTGLLCEKKKYET